MFVLRSKYNELKEDLKLCYEMIKIEKSKLATSEKTKEELRERIYGPKGLGFNLSNDRGLLAENAELMQKQLILNNRIAELEAIVRGNSGFTFDMKEIKTLINLCHPDKHDGKKSAQDITAKLLNIKANQQGG